MALVIGSNGNNLLNGTNSGDIILAGGGNDTVNGGGGSDIIDGGTGNDILNGGAGDDLIDGGSGNDTIDGGTGNDILDGGDGNDTINGGAGTDLLLGGSGNDTLNAGSGSDIINAGSGNDVVIHVGSENVGTLNVYDGGQGRDTLRLVVSASLAQSAAFQAELASFRAQLAHGVATFASLGIIATSFESVEIVTESGGNSAPTDIALSNGSVAENSSAGTVVGQLSATDPNAGDTHTFTIVGGRSDLFEVAGTSLRVKAGASLDFETATSLQVIVRATDAGGLTYDETLTISVTNVNETPTDIALAGQTVQENAAAGTLVGTLSATDPDAAGASNFTLVDNAGGRFAIVGNQLVVAGPIDYEGATSHQVKVRVTDAGGLSYEETFTIGVTNVNEAPIDIALSSASVQENATAGTVVGTLSATDPDAAGASNFTLVDNAGGRFAIVGNQLVVAGALDYEGATSHQVKVRVTDAGGLSYEETFAIGVTNVNEKPTDITFTGTSVSENAAAGTVVGTLGGSDPDVGDTLTFSLMDDAGGRFALDGNTIVVNGALDRETFSSHQVSVRVTDADNLTHDETFTIGVSNVNEAPTLIDLTPAPVQENAEGVEIGTVTAIDPDAGDTLTLTVDDDRFEIVGGKLKLKADASLDFDVEPQVIVKITATDAGGLSTHQSFTITVEGGAEGFSIDGYIAGATVFADTSGDGIWQEGEAKTVTDENGFFTLFGGTGPLVMVGGTDISTNLAFEGVMRAPAGSTVVSPLTTLVVAIAEADEDLTIEEANAQVLLGLGLPSGIDLATFDPVAATLSSDASVQSQGQAAMAAAIQVQNTIVQAASLLEGAGADFTAAATAVVTQLATQISQVEPPAQAGDPVATVNLNDTSVISAVITTAATSAGADPQKVTETAAGAASVITASNTIVSDAAASSSGTSLLTTLAQVSVVAQVDAAAALNSVGTAGTASAASDAQTNFTVATVSSTMTTVTVGDVVGANTPLTLVGTSGADTLQGFAANDTLSGLGGNDMLIGGDGNDVLDGGDGIDRAGYAQAAGAVTINMAAGTASGAGVGADTLNAIEMVRGSNFGDSYDATGFGPTSSNQPSIFFQNVDGRFNEFEGMGGNDTIIGNGATRISYLSATAGVTVNLTTGQASGDQSVGTDTFSFVSAVRGSNFVDTLLGSNNAAGAENFEGRGGDDIIDGGGGFDRAVYSFETSGITVDLATGVVSGGGGNDTLDSIEGVRGTEFADSFTASGFTLSSGNAGSSGANATGAAFNEFEGMGGNDTITGNGNTRLAFYGASGAVTVDIAAGTATGDASVGTDTFTGVSAIAGSFFNDILRGSNTVGTISEVFDGRGGNDLIDGRGGFDQVVYNNDSSITSGITVNMAAGTVTGAGVGTDTLVAVEAVRGTNFADTYVAAGFAGASTDTGLTATFNDFEGLGGDDVITGNGDTRLNFSSASSGVTVDLVAGTASGNASVGNDTFTGVNRVRGSNNNDTIRGDSANNVLEGQAGNDTLEGRGGNDILTGGIGGDTFVVGSGADSITDFNRVQGDKIDLRGVPGIFNLAQVQAIAFPSGGSHTFVNFGNGNTLFLSNVTTASLLASDFIFAPNTTPTDIVLSGNSIAENSFPGAFIGNLSAVDPDAGDSAAFSLIDSAGGLFRIDGNALVVNGALDYESGTSYQITVRATDSVGHSYDETFTVNVTNQNESPWLISLSDGSVPENAAVGAVVGTLTASDPDVGDSATFELLNSAGGLFAIDGTNLVVNGTLDVNTASSHQVVVRVTDAGGLTHDETFTIFVTNANDAPTDILISSNSVAENAVAGTEVGLLSALDPDFGDLANFTLLDDAGGRFDLNGATLVVAGALDYEAASSHQITVRVTDAANNTYDEIITIAVTNQNEAPSDIALAGGTVIENSTAGTVVGTLSAIDPDAGDSVTYELLDSAGGLFALSGTSITVAGALDYEAASSHQITVRATDAGGLSHEESFTITVGNQNEAPSDISLSATTIAENSAQGAVVGLLTALDPDANDTASFILLDDAGGRFAIDGGNLTVAGALDYESASSHQITVQVTDAGGLTHEKTFTIAVSNQNEAPTSISLSANSVVENSAAGTLVGTLSALDPDAGDNTTFTLEDSAGGLFAINGNNLVVAGAIDHEVATLHQVTVRATDAGGLFKEQVFTVGVSDVTGITVTGDASANSLVGTPEDDVLQGLGGDDQLQGLAGNDQIDGGDGLDRAIYTDATGGLIINMVSGTVNGAAGYGNDLLQSVEMVRGSNFADSYGAGAFDALSANAPSISFQNADGRFNEFEGMGGDDTIMGNGSTRVSYLNATAGVTVNLAGTAFSTAGGDAASIGVDTLSNVNGVRGSVFADVLIGTNNQSGVENFEGRGGADNIAGNGGFDRAVYTVESNAITVNLAAGTVTGGDGNDILSSIEGIRGTSLADSFDATGFTTSSANVGSAGTLQNGAAFNEFEGMGGNDSIIGNGNTRIAFYNATAGVTVDIATGTASSGDGSTGNDTFSLVNAIAGSYFNDFLYGSSTLGTTSEIFDGRNGNDTIDGRGGFDIAVYNNDSSVTAGITVNMAAAAGNVTGGAGVGTDTLIAVESVRGTNFADTYVATGFTGASTDTGLAASFNEFEGMGGNDSITGNGNTRISFVSASGGVTVDLAAGTASGNTSVGSDTFTLVNRVRGSQSNDTILGNGGNNVLEGQNGADTLTGRGGADTLTGGGGNDTFVFTAVSDSAVGSSDTITDYEVGIDVLRLTAIDANTATGGDDAFFYGGQSATVLANSVTWTQSGGNTIVSADVNGDAVADLTFTLTGPKTLTASDFLL